METTRLADLTFHGPYARSDHHGRVVWAWIAVHPYPNSRSWPAEMKRGWPIYGQTVVCAPPDAQKRRRHVRSRKAKIVGYVWSEYVFCGSQDGRHPDDPLNDPLHPDQRLHQSAYSDDETGLFLSWLTERKKVV